MKIAERIVMSLLALGLVGGFVWIYFAVQASQQEVRDAVARGEYERPIDTSKPVVSEEDWRIIYPNTVTITIGGVPVEASIADTLSSRIKGLSGTPFIPDGVVKLFAFGVPGSHSIWMKDMNYPIDILWVAENGEIVYLKENISPETYPEAFSSPVPAWFVVEANAGFVTNNQIEVGDEVVLPTS